MSLVISALTMGLILSLLSLGMLISFRMVKFTDITVDGTITLGASITAILLVQGWSPWLATLVAFLAGSVAGMITGILHTRFKIQEILAGILVMTALYSINLRIMGRSNIPLLDTSTLSTGLESFLHRYVPGDGGGNVFGWLVPTNEVAVFCTSILICILCGILMKRFLLTQLGTALRSTGENAQMVRAQGVNNHTMTILGLLLSNGLVAISGSLLAQYQGFADVQMGIGMMVWGLASVIIGEALVGKKGIGIMIVGTILGTILFRLLIAIALRWGLNPNDLKLVTAFFVFIALVAPGWLKILSKNILGRARHA